MTRSDHSQPRSRAGGRLSQLWATLLLALSLAASVVPGATADPLATSTETDPSTVW